MIPVEIILEKIADTRRQLFNLDSLQKIRELNEEEKDAFIEELTTITHICAVLNENANNRINKYLTK